MHGSATVGWMPAGPCACVATSCQVRARGAGGMQWRAAAHEALVGPGTAATALPGSVSALSPLVFPFPSRLRCPGSSFCRRSVPWEHGRTLLREHDARPGRRADRPVPHVRSRPVGTPRSPPPSPPREGAAMIYDARNSCAHGAAGTGGHAAAGAAASGLPLLTAGLLLSRAVHVLRGGLLHLLPAAPLRAVLPPGRPAGGRRTAADRPEQAAARRVATDTGTSATVLPP